VNQIKNAAIGPEPGVENRSAELSGRIVIVVNPVSGKHTGKHKRDVINRIAEMLQNPTRDVEVIESDGLGDICEIARTVVAQAILIAGGMGLSTKQ
jgi:diacylglycerol kinase family enzyme